MTNEIRLKALEWFEMIEKTEEFPDTAMTYRLAAEALRNTSTSDSKSLKQKIAEKLRDELTRHSAITTGISDERLIEICNAERHGRIIVLPCEIGDQIFIVHTLKSGHGFISSATVSGIHLRDETYRDGLPKKEYLVVRKNGYSKHIPLDALGRTAFFAYEEAKKSIGGEQHGKKDP